VNKSAWLDYQIVVPSRKRPFNTITLNQLLPTALICVDERERLDYAAHVPLGRLLLHPPMDGAPRVRNWIQDAVRAPCLIMLDDDFVGVQVNVGSRRYLTDADEILAILENSALACSDLGLSCFCYSRTQNLTQIDPDYTPIKPVQQVFGCFGMMGRARHRKYDESLKSRADLDWTLRTMLDDRCVYADVRFYFDFGTSFTGQGGNTGLVSGDDFLQATRIVRERWGRHVSFKPPGYVKNREITPGRVVVSRTNKAAQK
jgi:hypothetical protein